MKKHKIDVRSTRPFIGRTLDIGLLRRCIRKALDAEGVDMPCEISVLITDDEGIRVINHDFRQKNESTDVLSFPLQTLIPGHFSPDLYELNRDTGYMMLGDIVLSCEHIAEQAMQYGQSINREMIYLAIHSVLHLLGYDHLDEADEKRRMRAREEAILKALRP